MSRLPSLNCVQGQVSSSLSLHSVSVRPADYEPGLASLTLRCSTRGDKNGEVRVVHGGEDIYSAVKEAVKGLDKEKEPEIGDNPEGYWATSVGNSLIDNEIRNKFCLSLLGHITARSYDVVTSCTVTSDTDHIEEVLTWLIKKQAAAVSTDISDTCAVVVTNEDVRVLGQGGENVVVVNNVVKEAVEKLVVGLKEKLDDGEGKRKGKFSESGYGSEDDKKDSSNEMINKIEEEESDEILDITSLSGGKSPCMLEQIETELKASFENLLASDAETNVKGKSDFIEQIVNKTKENQTGDVEDEALEPNDTHNLESEPKLETEKESHEKEDESGKEADSPLESKVQSEIVTNSQAGQVLIESETSPKKSQIESTDSPKKSQTESSESPKKSQTESKTSPKKSLTDSATSPIKSGTSPKKSQMGKSRSLIASMLGGSPSSPHISKYRETHDDPQCPSSFSIAPRGSVDMSSLLIALCHGMFCRQWKFVTSCRLGGHATTLYFRHDPRILPGLGQQSLCGVVWRGEEGGEGVEVHNGSDSVVASVKGSLEGMMNAKTSVKTEGRVTALDLGECEMALCETPRLFNDFLQIMIKNGFNLYATVETEFKVNQMNVLMFRQSTVSNNQSLTLSLERGNVLVLYGGEEEDVVVVRETLASRWPYPVVQDGKAGEGAWMWKVRRYPWRISYGSKFVDRAVIRASKLVRQLSQDRLRQLPIPPPSNSDMESAKSLVIFLIKELSEKGWKFVGTNQVSAKMQHSCFLHFLK